MFSANRAARLCTFSSLSMFNFVCGSQAVVAYSRYGLTSEWYAVDLVAIEHPLMFRLRRPRIWLAFLQLLSMWAFQLKLSVIVIPKYLCSLTVSRYSPAKVVSVWRGVAAASEVHDSALLGVEVHLPCL